MDNSLLRETRAKQRLQHSASSFSSIDMGIALISTQKGGLGPSSGKELDPLGNCYNLFGLKIVSELPLPELFECDADGPADVSIRVQEISAPRSLTAGVHSTAAGTLLVIEECARYLITGGAQIVIEPLGEESSKNVRLYLLGSAFGLLLHQRKLLPLHANAVQIGEEAVVFMGPSGVGKSTLAAWFHDSGYRIMADDVSVISLDEHAVAYVHPGLPRLRLWEEALLRTGRAPDHYPLSFEGDETYDKRDVRLSRENVVQSAIRLGKVVRLNYGKSELKPLSGVDAVDALFSNTYRGFLVEITGAVREHWIACTKLALTLPIFEVGLRSSLNQLDEECEELLHQLRQSRERA